MKRLALVLALVGLLAVGVIALLAGYGQVSAEWLGWRMDTTAAALAAAAVLIAMLTAVLLASVAWLVQAPARLARTRGDARRRARHEALTRGFLALAAGDPAMARKLARQSGPTDEDAPVHPLASLLAAWGAEAEGDLKGAILAYEPLLADPESALAARRGLMQIAERIGDEEAALAQAQVAWKGSASAAWAWRRLFEDRLRAGDWAGATELAQAAETRRTLPPGAAERLRQAVEAARQGRPDPSLVDAAIRPVPDAADEPLTLKGRDR